MAKTVKVAILGGGMAGVAAAWELTHNPPPGVTYDVTVYEASFRLGGKCASGRNAAAGNRIEEHGIHILMGFYSQLLRILRDGYAEVDPALGFGPFSAALEPGDVLQLPDYVGGSWDFWKITFPTNARKPGDDDPTRRDFLGALSQAAGALAGWVQQYEALVAPPVTYGGVLQAAIPGAGLSPAQTLQRIVGLAPTLQGILGNPPNPATMSITVRHLWMAIWFAATNLVGIIQYGLFTPAAFQSPTLNATNYKDWLLSIGGSFPSSDTTYESPIVHAIYDLVFSRATGFAAGVALYDTLMMLFLYAGHVFYRMAGTGDVVFAPLYFALKAKGVHFRFAHTITDVQLGPPAPDGTVVVNRILMTGDGTERTVAELFIQVHGKYCWPTQSLVNRPAGPITLGPGDFDYVISAIPIGAIASSAPGLMTLPVISKAVAGITTIPTQSIQLWLDQTTAQMGWTGGRLMLGSFERPFNSCADMSQVLPVEDVAGEQCVLYMSDVYSGNPTQNDGVEWCTTSLPKLLPGFSWARLIDPSGGVDSARFAAQYWRANTTGTELYVASSPGTVQLRPPADGAGVENLLLASDWVITEENAGCVEGAARSGVQAAAALSVRASMPAYEQNDGDWVFPGPVLLSGATAQAFPFLVDPAALAALCARYSVGGATVVPWDAAIPLVIVFGSTCDDITSTDPRYATFGILSEREVGVFVPVKVTDPSGKTFTALVCPYLYVDNGATMACGREIYGIPKELASFPAWPSGTVPLPLTVTGLALQTRGDAASQREILTVSELVALPPILAWDPGGTLKKLWQEIFAADATVTLVALKQFHAIEDGAAACYQSLVRCSIVPNVKSATLSTGIWAITFPADFFPNPSATLGLASGAMTIATVQASLDYTLTLGSVVATAS